ncbi:MAG: hypothetical protein RLZZ618_1957 [Pseudomonadota bacterium]|jgi:LPS-assembly lipoprotein
MTDTLNGFSLARRLLVVGGAAALAGCGFQLRRAPELAFQRLYLNGFKFNSPMADNLRQVLRSGTNARVVPTPEGAEVILEALTEASEKSVVHKSVSSQVLEVQIRARLRFQVRTPAGKELIGPTELLLSRDMTYNEKDALAKEQEEDLLTRAMLSDIAMQVLHRLAALRNI